MGTVSTVHTHAHNQMLLTSLLANITLGTMYGRHLPSTAVNDSCVSLSFEICIQHALHIIVGFNLKYTQLPGISFDLKH